MSEGKKVTSYVCTIKPDEAEALHEYLQARGWEFKEQPYARFKACGDKVNVVAYLSGKLTVQGANTPDFVEFILEPEILHSFSFGLEAEEEKEEMPDLMPHIGVDESGKGDFFGPLVVAAVYIDEESGLALFKSGVRDSKVIKNDKEIVRLAGLIRGTVSGNFALLTLRPETYNKLYGSFQNLNRLLAWGHARVIENTLEKVPDCPRALSDQFGSQHLIKNALLERGRKIKMEQRTKAESDVAVAAASILARDQFIREMRKMGESAGFELQRGAGPLVRKQAEKLFAQGGEAVLSAYTKNHFKTYQEVVNS